MPTKQTPEVCPIGLDVGTSRIVTARRSDAGYEYQSQLNAFVTLPYSKMTEAVLKKEKLPHTVTADNILVHGTESERFADMLGVEVRRPMAKGVLNSEEPESLAQMRTILESMLGKPAGVGQKVYFSVPAALRGSEENVTYHEATLKQMLTELGFDPRPLNEGLAVIYAELDNSNFTGIGVSCGGGLCNVALAYLSVPVLSFSVSKAGDFIDSSAAVATGELINRIRLTKEDKFYFNGYFADQSLQALSIYYEEMIQTLVETSKEALLSSKKLPRLGKPIPLVLSGGCSVPRGFQERFEAALRMSDFPVEISEVRVSKTPLESTARGALIAGLSEL